ncbi:MAG: VIT domain-containing protein [Gemmatimonadales bacterium]|jgi:Ca-activated chloride channel family protein
MSVPAVERTSSQVVATLADRVVHYTVTETFINVGPALAEADLVFPLPSGAAFQDLQLSINGQLVAGEALNATEARGIYEEIVRRLRDPALVEWMGTGMLRARIFPFATGEVKKVVVRFQAVAQREGDALRVDYAGAAGPTRSVVYGELPPTSPVSLNRRDMARGGDDGAATSLEPSFFTLTYRAADASGTPYSPTHTLRTEREGDRQTIHIDGVPHDVTILLPASHSSAAAVTMLPYAAGDGPGFALITVAPPAVHVVRTPRDLTFVLDVSGSMSGHKIEQARAAGRQVLATLTPRDRFRLLDFSTDVRTFADHYETATPEHIAAAERYLDQLEADGSTNIEAALRAALRGAASDGTGDGTGDGAGDADESRLPLTLFITDGEPTIGERSAPALVAQAVAALGHTRLFTFGLGADVNSSLLEQLALQGHGTAQFVRPDESVERAVSLVASRLSNPVITDVSLSTDGVRLTHLLPALPADLFAGQDLILLARYQGSGPAQLRFTGHTANGPVSWSAAVTFPERERANPFVARLWATQQIGYLEAERHRTGPSPELDAELAGLGERYGIPTELTSYLVREPMVTANATPLPSSMMLQRKAEGDRSATPQASPREREAYLDAKQASAQRAAINLASADSAASTVMGAVDKVTRRGGSSGAMNETRRAGDRTFVMRDSVWTDTRYKPTASLRVVRVQAFSDAYFALARAVPDLRDAFAAGDRVLVAGRSIAVEVTPSGVATLADVDVAAVRAGW